MSGSRPNKAVAAQYLENHFTRLREQVEVAKLQFAEATVWHWNPADQMLTHEQRPLALVNLSESVDVARVLHQYRAEDTGDKLRYWMSRLEYEKLAAEPSQSLQADRFPDADPRYLETVLIESLKADRVEAAIGAVELLGGLGNEEFLLSDGGQPSPVAKALSNDNPRLRFAAANTIMQWNPTTAYAGSSMFLKTLALWAGTTGSEYVVLIEPNAIDARSLAGSMSKVGLHADASSTARSFLNLAVSRPDYAFAVVTASVNNPDAFEVIQRLRRDPRSASLPVALLGLENQMERIKEYAESDRLTKAFPLATSAEALQFMREEMAKLEGRDFVPQEIKIRQASAALDGLLKIARDKPAYPFYDLLQHEDMFTRAVYHPELSAKAVELLGWLSTPKAQRALVGLASESNSPIEIRRAAVKAFANAVQRRGTLLTRPEILQQYDTYNASESLDKETQEVLGAVLDVIEARVMQSAKTATE
jgi:CheY-like chemotaxis protein